MNDNAPPPAPSKGFARKRTVAIFWGLLLGAYLVYTLASGLTPLDTYRRMLVILRGSYGPLLFILVYTLRPLVLFPATFLTVGAGFLYGPYLGLLYTTLGANLGATLAYGIGYMFGQGVLEEGLSESRMQRYAERMRRDSFETVLLMRFLFVPFDVVNYLAGFLRIRYLPFLIATVLGSIPGTLASVLFGASTDGDFSDGFPSLDLRVLGASVVIFALSLLFSRYLKAREGE